MYPSADLSPAVAPGSHPVAVAQPIAQPIAQPVVAHPVAQPVVAHPVAQPIVHPVLQACVFPTAMATVQPVAQPIATSFSHPAAHATVMAQPVAQQGGALGLGQTGAVQPPPAAAQLPGATALLDVSVRVAAGETVLKSHTARPYREYTFTLEALGVSSTLCGRFSELERSLGAWGHPFPKGALHFAFNFTTNETNVRGRAQELRSFLDTLLNDGDEGGKLATAAFHTSLQLAPDSPMVGALRSVGAERKRLKEAACAAEAARLAAIVKQQLDDCAFAQTFNTALAYSNLPPGALTTITFPREQTFELRNKFWGWGDATIKGPGGHPWFQMVRTNPSLFGELFKNAHFAITTRSGEPLLVLQERFRWANYEYDLFRIDPRTRQHVPVVKISRSWADNLFHVTDQYRILPLQAACGLHGHVECTGRWPDRFTLTANRALLASVRKQLFSLTDKYHVDVAPHTDVLLMVGIACAIDRIHHEVEDQRERRRR